MFFIIFSVYKKWQMNSLKNTKRNSERCQNYFEEEKDKRKKKFRERYQNLSEEQKQKLFEYMRNYYLAQEKQIFSCFVDFFNFKKIGTKKLNFLIRYFRKFFLVMPYENFFEFFISWISPWNTGKFLKCRNFVGIKNLLLWKKFLIFLFWLAQNTPLSTTGHM